MPAGYVEQHNGGYYVTGTRVSPTLEQVYGAIAFYLAHRADVDENIREGEEELERSVPPLNQARPDLYARLRKAREELAKPR